MKQDQKALGRESWRVFFAGVGGQGTLLASRVLGEAALLVGVHVVVSEIHGMAQRGGVVESAVLLGKIESPTISDGEADVLLGFEPLETLRAVRKCNEESLVISNTSPLVPFTIASSSSSNYPDIEEMMSMVARRVGRLITLDALELARNAGSELTANMVLLGALLRHGDLPFDRQAIERVLTMKTKKSFLEMNLKAFELGFQQQ
ncbi:MAG: indolepyruvate oxidoreductase subunit beta [Deltaproteobacteria bacterium]|nr:indolepyruvate oxidoreductase subunit beta [Deltaproteobacteria bacterium]MBW2069893.1 indolepyruvate oxidoreductase subunit beta [Deltaproteobacteria bacterium]